MMRSVKTKTTYLEMRRPCEDAQPPPCDGVMVMQALQPSVAFYRFLYDAVGRRWQWINRTLLDDDELGAIIHDDRVEIYVLYVDGNPAGFAELDRRQAGEIELAYFGLTPEYIGRGLGKYLLNWALRRAWSYRPRRVWVHTCDLDHPAALAFYQKAGFVPYAEEWVQQRLE
jgi:GNAT superfamily N-acetyltransferase